MNDEKLIMAILGIAGLLGNALGYFYFTRKKKEERKKEDTPKKP